MHSLRTGAAAAAAVLAVLGAPALARGDAVTDWNIQATTTILAPPAPTSHYSALPFAMVHGAMYDAVNAIDKSRRPYLHFESNATRFDSQDAAAATAAFKVLWELYPTQRTALEARYATSLADVLDGPAAKAGGIAAGAAAAAAMLKDRENDGRNPTTAFPFVFGTTAGVWRLGPQILPPFTVPGQPIDGTPWVGNVRPFLVSEVAMLRTKGPNALTSRKYAKEFNEVKAVGSLTAPLTVRSADQTTAAIFWQSAPIALYSGAMRSLSASMSEADKALLFARVGLAVADGAIGCWNDKYYWNWWRPIDAIRQGNNDGNPGTAGDPNWLPLFDPSIVTTPRLTSPGFPDHPSGHSCLTSAAFNTMRDFFHKDKVAFDIKSSRFAEPRHFDSFSQALQEVIDARVWGGIHFRTADEQGATLGKKVAKFERSHFFQRVGDDDDEEDDDEDDD
jgi:hypothetical protein